MHESAHIRQIIPLNEYIYTHTYMCVSAAEAQHRIENDVLTTCSNMDRCWTVSRYYIRLPASPANNHHHHHHQLRKMLSERAQCLCEIKQYRKCVWKSICGCGHAVDIRHGIRITATDVCRKTNFWGQNLRPSRKLFMRRVLVYDALIVGTAFRSGWSGMTMTVVVGFMTGKISRL